MPRNDRRRAEQPFERTREELYKEGRFGSPAGGATARIQEPVERAFTRVEEGHGKVIVYEPAERVLTGAQEGRGRVTVDITGDDASGG